MQLIGITKSMYMNLCEQVLANQQWSINPVPCYMINHKIEYLLFYYLS